MNQDFAILVSPDDKNKKIDENNIADQFNNIMGNK